jgi:AcrR family transcriptional regulator
VPGTPGMRERARLDALERIRSTAVALLAERSLNDLTTREVAELAGVSEATLFRCVGSKHALLVLAYGDRVDALLDRIEEADRRTAAAVSQPSGEFYCQRVLDAWRMRSELFLESPENGALYLHAGTDQHVQDSPSLRRGFEQAYRLIGMTAGIVREGQRTRCLRSEFDADLIAVNCHGTYRDEMEHTVKRGLETNSFHERVNGRLAVQLFPLIVDSGLNGLSQSRASPAT